MIDVLFLNEEPQAPAHSVVEEIAGVPDFSLRMVSSAGEAEDSMSELAAAILVIGPSTPRDSAIAIADRLRKMHAGAAAIWVPGELVADAVQRAFRAGFRDVVHAGSGELEESIRRTHEQLVPEVQATTDGSRSARVSLGRVITFLGAKGGSGKTVFATNTAVGLSKRQGSRVILLDLDSQFGDVGVMLSLPPQPGMSELVSSSDRLDTEMLKGFLSRHDSGVDALLAPAIMEASPRVPPANVERIIKIAQGLAEFVIIDTPTVFDETTIAILNHTDSVFLVANLDVPSIKDAQIILQALRLHKYPDGRINLLLNRADSKVSLLPSDVERHLKHEISVQIPSDRSVPISVNQGVPLLMGKQRRPVDDALNRMVTLAYGVTQRDEIELLEREVA